jgi:hypothetical protein
MTNYYTGIGSRDTPEDVLEVMRTLASIYKDMGWVLRSGGSRGADTAFESGAGDSKEIYLTSIGDTADRFVYDKARRLAAMYHPAWVRLPEVSQKFHTRNAFQVLGMDMQTPSNMIICWTKDGCVSHYTRDLSTGGTGTAISIAFYKDIPILNLARPMDMWVVRGLINSKKEN